MAMENEPTPPTPDPLKPDQLPEATPLPEAHVRGGAPAGGLSAEDLITLNDEIAGMARAGLPLDQGMAALAKEMRRGRLQRVTADIAADLRRGSTLPEAMARQAGRVPRFYAGLVAAGVRSGRISDVLATLTVYARTLADLRSLIVGALFYPAMVTLLAFTLFGFVFFYLIPQYEEIFNSFRIRLPLLTEIMIGISHHPLPVLGIPLGIAAALVIARLGMGRTGKGRRAWTRFVYGVPLVGTLLRSARLAAFTDLLGILVDHGTPLPDAFVMAGESSSDPFMAEAAGRVREDLCQGQPLGEVLRRHQLVPELVAWMTAMAERHGNLGETLHHVAAMYRRQAEMRAALLRSVLPPFLIIVTAGILVTLFIIGVALPMVRLLEGLSGNAGGFRL
jgi:type II secretory pathway component PulF